MRAPNDFPVSLRILLPFLAALVLLGGPRLQSVDREIAASQAAISQAEPLAEARHLMNVISWEPWREDLWLRVGQQALRGGDSVLAIWALEKSRQIDPANPAAALSLGEAYWAQKDLEPALAVWDRMIADGHAPTTSVFQRIIQWKRQAGQLRDAYRYAQSWIEFDPKNSQAAYTWDLLAMSTQTKVSQSAIFRAVELDPGLTAKVKPFMDVLGKYGIDSPAELRLLEAGRVLGTLGEWDLALAAFQQARDINPEYAEAWAYIGIARQQLGQSGTDDVQKALELKPASAAIQAMAGLLYRHAGAYEKAISFYNKASELEPANPIWIMEVGNLYADLLDTRAGLAQYQKAAGLQPENSQIWRGLADYCLFNELDVRQVGLPAARLAVSLAPNSAQALDTLGQTMAWLGDGDSAERFLQQALEKDPNEAAAALHLGQLYINWGRWSQAEYYLAQAAQIRGQASEANVIASRLLDRYFGRH